MKTWPNRKKITGGKTVQNPLYRNEYNNNLNNTEPNKIKKEITISHKILTQTKQENSRIEKAKTTHKHLITKWTIKEYKNPIVES